eukprot:3131227-Rhodomonas_salina.1
MNANALHSARERDWDHISGAAVVFGAVTSKGCACAAATEARRALRLTGHVPHRLHARCGTKIT